ncbi:hypothetical protein ABFS82_06G173300 [Erythranthe guttata]|uniref:F-box domain-containing protein n=1 Tax=Erythranthe guttata TaxID=4155 RepID=A0A022RJ51_ERYGU|nr:PREDICTED: F-box/kelch-repeat protein At3g23880-like [Erythranthe guttata]EYU39783.1 hypothetical protein MIMGU_mgv1a021693mg [Erythranthe guttata]|eukprot:XP_012834533.1 PREDICTED: F-box/kelch-repeat protein At3g23880-like [Erythranthe guttata]
MEAKPDSNSSISDHHQPRRFRRRIETPAAAETLPEEIIEQILVKLPVKSLLKFTSVSKSWRSLISSNRFIEAHLEFSRKDPNFTHYRTISTYLPPRKSVEHCSFPSLFNGLVTDAADVDVDFPFDFSKKVVRVMGTCNGLVWIAPNMGHWFLWNPSTRQYKQLPDECDRTNVVVKYDFKHAFGYDESTRDYKVLLAHSVLSKKNRYETTVKIYSLRTDSWKRIKFFNNSRHPSDSRVSGIFVNGKIHWCKDTEPNSRCDIVSFDLGSEVWGSVAEPSCVESGYYESPSLGVLDGCLCVLYDFSRSRIVVWAMKEYGVSESWAKTVTVPYVDLTLSNPSIIRPSLCVGPKGEILCMLGSSLMIYNPNDNRFRRPGMRNFGAFLEAHVYYESLVPLA